MNFASIARLSLLTIVLGAQPSPARAEPADLFREVCGHLAGAYEQLGRLDGHYDEEGFCGPDCSIWLMTTDNPDIAYHLISFEPISGPGASGPGVGRYVGFVDFPVEASPRRVVRLNLDFVYSGEDITVDVTVSEPALPVVASTARGSCG